MTGGDDILYLIRLGNNTMLPARDSWRVNTAHVSSCVLISILRGQPRTPPSGENLGALDYHLEDDMKIQFYLSYDITRIHMKTKTT